jgi:hypothetical protein
MRFNGRAYNKAILKSMSAYVMQDDLLHAELTVVETLSYASELRLPQLTDEERTFREEEVLALMNIEHTKDVIIGDTRRMGISGGERKRVCIAVELLTRPKLIFFGRAHLGPGLHHIAQGHLRAHEAHRQRHLHGGVHDPPAAEEDLRPVRQPHPHEEGPHRVPGLLPEGAHLPGLHRLARYTSSQISSVIIDTHLC